MKKRLLNIILGVIAACVLFVAFLAVNNDIGVRASRLEEDIRTGQKISDAWTVEGSVSDRMAAFLSYPQDRSEHTFSIYIKHSGLSFGYFFRAGGNLAGVEDHIAEFSLKGYPERAFLSMNAPKVVKLEVDNGTGIQVIDLDRDKPFAIVLPVDAGDLTFYDENGQVVEVYLSRG